MEDDQPSAPPGGATLARMVPPDTLALLAEDAGVRITVFTPDGLLLFANSIAQDRLRRTRGIEAFDGLHLRQIVTPEMFNEALSAIRHAHRTRRPTIVDSMINGVRVRAVLRAITWDRQDAVLVTSRDVEDSLPIEPEALPGYDILVARHGDRGPLAALTKRELQVLRYIGEGRTTEQIAAILGRSTKTIEWHRASLGQKLGCSNRVELARIAIKAGLASTSRYSLPMPAEPTPDGVPAR